MLTQKLKAIVLVTLCLLSPWLAQATDKTYEIETHKVTDHVYVLSVAWSDTSVINSAIVIGDHGVMLITAQMLPVAPSLEAKIAELTDKPITHVLNVASDTFHHHANDYFRQRGADIISQKEVGYSDASTQILFDRDFSIDFGNERVTATYTRAHAKGQTIVHLKNSNVMLLGDAFRTDKLIYTGYHGVTGQVSGFAQAYDIANDDTVIVSGHKGERLFSNRVALKQASDVLVNFSALVGKKYQLGMTVDQMIDDNELQNAVSIYPIYKQQPSLLQYNIRQLIDTEFTQQYPVSDSQLRTFVGSYHDNKGSHFEVDLADGHLFVGENGKFLFKLTAMAEDKFYIWKSDSTAFYMQFHHASDGRVMGISPEIPEGSYWLNVIPQGVRQKR